MTENDGLTRDQLKALRHATSVVFRGYWPGAPYAPDGLDLPATLIEAVKEEDPGDGFGRRDRRVEIPTEPVGIVNYADSHRPVESFAWVLHYLLGWSNPMGTLIHGVLRVGDRLHPQLLLSNDSENTRNAGLTVDELRLTVERGPVDQPAKVKKLLFVLDHSIGPPESLGRHVKFASPPTYSLREA